IEKVLPASLSFCDPSHCTLSHLLVYLSVYNWSPVAISPVEPQAKEPATMNNEPNPQQWGQPQPPPTQYEQQQQWAQPQPQWNQQPPFAEQYAQQPQQYAQNQYNQYSNVPAYAQPQVQADQTSNFLVRFF